MHPYCVYVTYHRTGKFYVDKAMTSRILDGSYRGSGTVLLDAFKKYPRSEWVTEVVKDVETEAEAYALEALWVDHDLIADDNCLNINLGGKGGCRRKQSAEEITKRATAIKDAISSPEHRLKMARVSAEASARPEVQQKRRTNAKRLWEQHSDMMLSAREGSYGEEWQKKLSDKMKTSRRPSFAVEVDGVRYERQVDACRALGLHRVLLRKLPTFREIH